MSRRARLVVRAAALVPTFLIVCAGAAGAQQPTGPDVDAPTTALSVNLLWVVIGAALVVFMQAGFAMVETGFCRAKHAAHVVSTNFMIFGLGFVAFFLVGFAFMFGGFSYPGYFGFDQAVGEPLIEIGDWVFLWKGGFALGDLGGPALAAPVLAFFLYMAAFMDTTATIPTGAMAERWKWSSFVWWGLFCGAIYYPLFGAWTWGGGWLNQAGNNLGLGFGYVDFAGSGVVHAVGGAAGLAGALVLGPRLGKYGSDGKPRGLLAHNIPMAMLGTFILLFGWFGFNAASTFAATDIQFATVAANTAIAAAFGSVMAMLWVTRRTGKPDPSMMANGMLAGLVAITAPCAFVQPWAAAVIGLIAGALVVEAVWFFERRARVDDPVGAVSVHGVCGLFGVLAVGIFADGSYGAGWNLTDTAETAGHGVTGILYDLDLGVRQLGAQTLGALVICTVIFGIALAFFTLQNRFTKGGIRPSADDEMAGLDVVEMGVPAYHDGEATGGSGAGLLPSPAPAPAVAPSPEPVTTG
jgi:ammonium transporter, Amt family